MKNFTSLLVIGMTFAFGVASLCAATGAPRQMENLGRGVVAINQGEGKVFVSWRLLGTEPDDIAFNIYRSTGTSQPVKLNPAPLSQCGLCEQAGQHPGQNCDGPGVSHRF